MPSPSVRPSRRGEDFSRILSQKGWYHSFELPDGTTIDGFNTLEILKKRWARFPFPQSLAGKRVLDIGAWDGWFSFEAERRGARVTAIDCVEMPNFLEIRGKLGSQVDYRVLDFYELSQAGLGEFDYVLFLGILYHLKHPLLALEMVCSLTTDIAVLESFVTDGDTWRDHTGDIPSMEFYETDELGNQLDNWIGPSVSCLQALCRAAGFARVEFLYAKGFQAGLVCYRRWEPVGVPLREPPDVVSVANSRTMGINFSTRKEEYVSCWFRTGHTGFTRHDLRFEVGGFGVPALYIEQEPNGKWLGNFRLPPGLRPGWQEARLRFADSDFSPALRVAIDMPVTAGNLVIAGACDGHSFAPGEVTVDDCGWMSLWARGLPENADRDNVKVTLDSVRLVVDFVGPADGAGNRQVNAIVPGSTSKGAHGFRVACGGAISDVSPVTIR